MQFFKNLSERKEAQILILGSYFGNNLAILESIRNDLRKEGFLKTYLSRDLIKTPNDANFEKNCYFYTMVEDLMLDIDYNIFIFFEENNVSVSIELATFLKSPKYLIKKDKCIVFLPKNYDISMLLGILEQQKVKIFRYFDKFEIFDYCKHFILLN